MKSKVVFLLFLMAANTHVFSQNTQEALQEISWDAGSGNMDLQPWEDLPVSQFEVNQADSTDWMELGLFTPDQVSAIMNYKRRYKTIRSVFELSTIPGINESIWRQLESRLSFDEVESSKNKETHHRLLMRYSQTLEQRRGYKFQESVNRIPYMGSPVNWLLRYRGVLSDNTEIGLILEKDSGEPFLWQPEKQYFGSEYVGLYVDLKKLWKFNRVILGSYRYQNGQGLIFGSSFFNTRHPEYLVYNKLQQNSLRPYRSANAALNHFRGLGASFGRKNWRFNVLTSSRPVSGTVHSTPASAYYLNAIRTSDYFRTETDLNNRFSARHDQAGISTSFERGPWHVGVNMLAGHFTLPLTMLDTGNTYYASSLFFQYSGRSWYAFGEVARDFKNRFAINVGSLFHLEEGIQTIIGLRHYQPGYYAPNSNAFGRFSGNQNEQGFYWGLVMQTSQLLKLSGFVDAHRNLEPRYGLEKPVWQQIYGFNITYTPSKNLELKCRYRRYYETDYQLNENGRLKIPEARNRWQIMTSARYVPLTGLRLTSFWGFHALSGQKGKLLAQDIQYKRGKYTIYYRVAIFDVDEYDVRMYLYENDLLYFFNVPMFQNRGNRHAFMLRYKLNNSIYFGLKLQMFNYQDVNEVGSGYEAINGNKSHMIRMQVRLNL